MTPPATEPGERRPSRWARTIAIVATPIALLLIGVRYRALASSVTSGFEQGRALGQLVGGPIVIGAVVWGVWVLWQRRPGSARFWSSGLVACIALAGIYAAFASVRG